jgi:ADP-heptose:LPS heptosyltransferase
MQLNKFISTIILRLRIVLYFLIIDKISILLGSNLFSKKQGVAIIRLDAIGDFILWLDATKEFRRLYPDKKITFICNEAYADFAKHFNYWDNVIPVNTEKLINSFLYRIRILTYIRRKNFEIVIHPTYSRVFLTGDSIVRASSASEKIGSAGDLSNISYWEKKISDKWYTKLIAASEKKLMEIERNFEFIENLGGEKFTPKIAYIPVLKNTKNLQINNPYFIVVPGAQWKYKMWKQENFTKIIQRLVECTGWSCVLCGSEKEFQLCNEIIEISSVPAINLAGKTNISEFVEVIRQAKILISNDTSAVHIAASVGTPSICILGGGHFGRFLPYPEYLIDKNTKIPSVIYNKMDCFGCNWKCYHNNYQNNESMPCIQEVHVDKVWNEVKKIIDSFIHK